MANQSPINKINPIDNTTVVTSVSFMSICIGLIVFIKKFPIEPNVTTITLIVLSLTTTLFGMSALISYIDIARTTCQKVEEVLSLKFLSYLMAIVLLGISAMMVIYPY